jgi:hypothetical protein
MEKKKKVVPTFGEKTEREAEHEAFFTPQVSTLCGTAFAKDSSRP